MIENLQDELNHLQNRQEEELNFVLGNNRWNLRSKKCLKIFFKVLERQNLLNQCLNCILMIINQNILAVLKTFSNLQKKL